MKLFFIYKLANWQKYRLEVLNRLAETSECEVEILFTAKLTPYFKDNNVV